MHSPRTLVQFGPFLWITTKVVTSERHVEWSGGEEGVSAGLSWPVIGLMFPQSLWGLDWL